MRANVAKATATAASLIRNVAFIVPPLVGAMWQGSVVWTKREDVFVDKWVRAGVRARTKAALSQKINVPKADSLVA
jgi:hypothetical protein